MSARSFRFRPRLPRFPSVGIGLLLLTGCRSGTPPPAAVPVANRTTASVRFSDAHVRSLPLFHEAETDCSVKQFRAAADKLARLATDKSLTPPERDFCLEQRNLCLKDAGLPAPPFAPSPSSVSTKLHAPHKPLSPEEANCGPRALLLVGESIGVKASLPALQKAAGTTGNGTTFAGLQRAAASLGLKTEGVQMSREALATLDTPAIAWVNENHYLAVLRVQGDGETKTALVHDPNEPHEKTISQEALLRASSGYLLLLHR